MQEKIDSIKTDLTILSIQKLTHEMDEEQRECADYKLAYDLLITKAREALTTLQELEADIASEEMVEKVEVAIETACHRRISEPCDRDGSYLTQGLDNETVEKAAKAAIKTMLGN